jgi:hypothetical protein
MKYNPFSFIFNTASTDAKYKLAVTRWLSDTSAWLAQGVPVSPSCLCCHRHHSRLWQRLRRLPSPPLWTSQFWSNPQRHVGKILDFTNTVVRLALERKIHREAIIHVEEPPTPYQRMTVLSALRHAGEEWKEEGESKHNTWQPTKLLGAPSFLVISVREKNDQHPNEMAIRTQRYDPFWDYFCTSEHILILNSYGDTNSQSWLKCKVPFQQWHKK